MTNEQKVEAYRMRLEGATLQECADRFGVTRECIRKITPPVETHKRGRPAYKSCIYPNLRALLSENRYGYSDFAKLCVASEQAIFNALTGKVNPRKSTIDKILDATGMTYEEAFRRE